MNPPKFISNYLGYFMDEIPLNKSAKTIQIFLVRETHDYTIFRTEETRELNIVTLPKAIDDPDPTIHVVMLASKQKAPENRMFIQLARTLAFDNDILKSDDPKDKRVTCSLKDNLCMRCPRCVLFGAVSTETGAQRWNIKHRIEYSSAYSLEEYEDIAELITFNAIDDATQSTGQALGSTENIRPVVHFPSIITLNTVTWKEFIMILKTLLATKSYGAETRIKGDMINHIVGIAFGYEEIMTSLEFQLELVSNNWQDDLYGCVEKVLKKYKNEATFPDNVILVTGEALKTFVDNVKKYKLDKEFINALYNDAEKFVKKVEERSKRQRGE